MKILWLVNIVMPDLATQLGREPSVFGGWLSGAMQAIKDSGNELVVCTTEANTKDEGCYKIDGVTYYIFNRSSIDSMKKDFSKTLEIEKPDVVHLYGTEYEHSSAMADLVESNKLLISVQGLVAYYEQHVYGGVPDSIAKDNIIHKLLRRLGKGGNSIEQQRLSYEKRSSYELNALKKAKYINGGTAWGNGCSKLANPDASLLPCELILRDSYYNGELWDVDKCNKHSIFTIYTYPIKGFDMFLKGLKYIVERYPDTKVYVAGNSCRFRNYSGLRKKIMDMAHDYDWYIQGLIEKYELTNNLVFLGYLNEEQMHNQLLKSNVFVSASAIENHSTALGEAMISGTPSVASCVGGLQEMIDHGKDGFLYPFNEPYMMAYYVNEIFENDNLAKQFSINGHKHAAETYDKEKNKLALINMYKTIAECK